MKPVLMNTSINICRFADCAPLMASSAGPYVTVCPSISFQQTMFCEGESALCQPHLQPKLRRRRVAGMMVACAGPAANGRHEVQPARKKNAMGRRALVALVGTVTHPSLIFLSRANETPSHDAESEQIRLETMQKLEARLPSTPLIDITTSASKLFNEEEGDQKEEGDSRILFYLNTLGYLVSGVLGSLFWFERQAKLSSDLNLQDLTSKLKAKEDAMVSLKQKLEAKLFEEEQHASSQFEKLREEQETLSNELASATRLSTELQEEINDKRTQVQYLQKQIKALQTAIQEGERQKVTLEKKLLEDQNKGTSLGEKIMRLKSEVQRKEVEIGKLRVTLKDKEQASTKLSSEVSEKIEALSETQHRIEEVEKDLYAENEKLNRSESAVQELRSKLAMAIAQGEEMEKDVAMANKELDGLKQLSADELQAIQAKLNTKAGELENLTKKLAVASKDTQKNKIVVGNLHAEISSLKQRVHEGDMAINHLKQDLNLSSQDVEAAKGQVDSLSKELKGTKELNTRLGKRFSEFELKAESNLTSLKYALQQEQKLSSTLCEELKKVKEAVDHSEGEAASLKEQLRSLEDSNEQLRREFAVSEDTVKATGFALEKEKEVAAASKKQLESTRRAMAEAKENLKLLQQDVEGAKLEGDNLIKDVADLQKKLEIANARVAGLEIEKVSLSEALNDERRLLSSLKEKVNEADGFLGKLSKETEIAAHRAKKLEGELASTKGEMLRLKKQGTFMENASKEAKIKPAKERSRDAARLSSSEFQQH